MEQDEGESSSLSQSQLREDYDARQSYEAISQAMGLADIPYSHDALSAIIEAYTQQVFKSIAEKKERVFELAAPGSICKLFSGVFVKEMGVTEVMEAWMSCSFDFGTDRRVSIKTSEMGCKMIRYHCSVVITEHEEKMRGRLQISYSIQDDEALPILRIGKMKFTRIG